jgi:hypothetical protein
MQYTIRSGDTLAQIAAAHGTPLEVLLSANPQYGTNPPVVHAGDVVLIPNVAPDSNENTQGPRGVRGWLLLLVAAMMVLGPLHGIGRIHQDISMAESQYPGLTSLEEWAALKSATWLTFFCVAALSFYGGWGLASGNNWSVVKRAKAILWITGPVASIVMGVLIPLMTFGVDAVDPRFIPLLIAAMAGPAIWTAYLSRSKRVRNTYGG